MISTCSQRSNFVAKFSIKGVCVTVKSINTQQMYLCHRNYNINEAILFNRVVFCVLLVAKLAMDEFCS